MFTTVRDLIEVAYDESKVIGTGMPITGSRMRKAERVLAMILLEEFVAGLPVSKEVISYQFTGNRTYTIGTEEREIPADSGTFVLPDIHVAVMPESIDRIVLKTGTTRYDAYPMNSGDYYGRGTDAVSTQYPQQFYYERQGFDNGFATINFIGNPSDLAEIVVTTSVDKVDQTTSINVIPKEIIPYITHEMAFRLADQSGFDGSRQKMQANRAYALYTSSTDDIDDAYSQESLGASLSSAFGASNRTDGMRQINSGEA